MIDPCENPDCVFYDRCPLRPGELPVEYTLMASLTPPKEPSFRVDRLGVGLLNIHGPIGAATTKLAILLLRVLHRSRGLLVHFDCTGGPATEQDNLTAAIRAATEDLPVLGVVRRAYSAAFVSAMACTRVFAESEDAEFGCFGGMAEFCDGKKPAIMASTGAPKKLPPADLRIGPTELYDYNDRVLAVQQRLLDERYEEDLEQISTWRKVPTDVLASGPLDGSKFVAKRAKYYDLIDGVQPLNVAYQTLFHAL